jgi:hypothetical protein
VLEVDTLGDAGKVEQAFGASWDYIVSNGRYVHFPTTCGTELRNAERWHGNVRVILSCKAAGASAAAWLGRVERAFAQLA